MSIKFQPLNGNVSKFTDVRDNRTCKFNAFYYKSYVVNVLNYVYFYVSSISDWVPFICRNFLTFTFKSNFNKLIIFKNEKL